MSESEGKIKVQTIPARPADIEVTISIGTERQIAAQATLGYGDMGAALTDLPRAAENFAARTALAFLASLTADSFVAEESDA